MFKKIKKRSGHLANFDRERIKIAFVKAGQSTNEYNADMAEELTKRVLGELQKEKDENGIELPTVEQVQDIAEIVLMRSSYRKTAKEYIIYRHKHKEIREVQKLFSVKTVDEYINGKDWRVRENANTTFSLQGLNNYVSSGVSGNYWLYGLYPAQIRDAHLNGDIHIHDLSSISSYCVGWDLYDFLQTGFTGVPTKISSKPPSHFESALGQIVNFFYTCQGESAGAQAFANFDTLLAPFIRKDCLSREDVKKSMRSFFFNCNIPTRTGFQTPFINVTLDFTVPNTFKDIPVIIGGKPQESTYKEYQNEMTLFNDVFFEVALEGDAYGRVFTFPIPTINITKDFDYNKCPSLWKAVVKYGLPYFANFVNSDMDPSDARSMCLSGETFIFYKKENKIKRKEIREVFNENKEENIEVLYKGNWINARPIKTTDTYDFYKIVLRNGSFFVATDNHLHLTSQGYKKSFDLREGDFLPISIYTNKKMYGNLGSYDFGRFLGLYLAEGSTCGKTKESLKDIQFSLGEDEQTVVDFLKNFCSINFGIQLSQTKNTGKSISLFARSLQPIINSYIIGKAKNKRLINWWRLNKECLEGLLFGWIEGDGSDMKDANTSSEKLAYQMLEIGLYIGYPMSIRREYIKSILNEKQYEGYNYVVQICKPEEGFKNDRRIFHKVGEYLWTKIVSIEKLYTHIGAYCVEVIKEKEPLFELSNRIITHNCCRLRIDNRVLQKRMGGLFNAAPLTGSIGVTTLNAARIGYESNNEKEFFNNLEQKMNISKDSLEIKRKAIKVMTDKGLYPYTSFYLRGVKEKTKKYWSQHFSTIGILGMNEACLNLFKTPLKDNVEFVVNVLNFMKDKILQYQKETGNMYNLESTPAEGCTYRLALLDKKKYPKSICANEETFLKGASPYYTNSTNLPVNYSDDIIDYLEIQDKIQPIYTGGTVHHVYLGETITEEQAKKLVQFISTKFSIPYFTLTPTFTICRNCGYLQGEYTICPKCKTTDLEVFSRIVGYLRPVQTWNEGKQEEFKDRKYMKV